MVVEILKHSVIITFFVFVMMVLIDYINVMTKGGLSFAVKGGKWRQYVGGSFLGAIPGCLGAFLSVSLYVHNLFSFGAVTAAMIATSGDEAFVMLAMFPDKAGILFGILFGLGTISGYAVDKLVPRLRIRLCESCKLQQMHLDETDECRWFKATDVLPQLRSISSHRLVVLIILAAFAVAIFPGFLGPLVWNWQKVTLVVLLAIALFIGITAPEHYLNEHIWQHIVKKHLWRVFLWTFGALLVSGLGLRYWNLEEFVRTHAVGMLLIASLVGMIPESGPHLVFVTMFADGLIPFSVLLASSVVQDGHGMLPMLSYTVKDALIIKLFNLAIGIMVGFIAFSIGW